MTLLTQQNTDLRGELQKAKEQMKAVADDKKSLEAELALIVDQIGFLSEYSTKKK